MNRGIYAKPFVKWAGGKSQLLKEIRRNYPSELGVRITKYAEPFVGGGAVLFDMLSCYNLKDVYISDENRELIHTYLTVRDNVDELIRLLKELENEYLFVNSEIRKAIYYRNRNHFNGLKAKMCESVEIAALFIFINKTCFNGLYRVNRNGDFNVPQGSYKSPVICDESNLRTVSELLRFVKIVHGDYWLSRDFIDENTFVYFDPPYRPLTATSGFTSYTNRSFGDKQQIKLARFIDEMSERGACILASNSDPTNIDENDDFLDRLYSKHIINRITAGRSINSNGNGRGRVRELLIVNV